MEDINHLLIFSQEMDTLLNHLKIRLRKISRSCWYTCYLQCTQPRNTQDWTLPTPSAFNENEINNIVEWVRDGGSLFLIADHMPFPGAAQELARAFGVEMNNGFAFDSTGSGTQLFIHEDETLKDNFIHKWKNCVGKSWFHLFIHRSGISNSKRCNASTIPEWKLYFIDARHSLEF